MRAEGAGLFETDSIRPIYMREPVPATAITIRRK